MSQTSLLPLPPRLTGNKRPAADDATARKQLAIPSRAAQVVHRLETDAARKQSAALVLYQDQPQSSLRERAEAIARARRDLVRNIEASHQRVQHDMCRRDFMYAMIVGDNHAWRYQYLLQLVEFFVVRSRTHKIAHADREFLRYMALPRNIRLSWWEACMDVAHTCKDDADFDVQFQRHVQEVVRSGAFEPPCEAKKRYEDALLFALMALVPEALHYILQQPCADTSALLQLAVRGDAERTNSRNPAYAALPVRWFSMSCMLGRMFAGESPEPDAYIRERGNLARPCAPGVRMAADRLYVGDLPNAQDRLPAEHRVRITLPYFVDYFRRKMATCMRTYAHGQMRDQAQYQARYESEQLRASGAK